MNLELITLCEFAATTQNMRLMIAGTFNQVTVNLPELEPGQPMPPLAMPPCYLVAVVNASIAEGLEHMAELRVVNEDHVPVFDAFQLGPWQFIMNEKGRPLRYQAIMTLFGMTVPRPGEYSFELWLSGTRVGETPLYVDVAAG